MRIPPDEAFDALRKFTSTEWKHISESDTRAKIIDPMLKFLNWQEPDITREEHTETGYLDYILRVRNRNSLVIEAKRVGKSFTLPITFNFRRKLKVRYVISTSDLVKKAMLQAQSYCASKGARFAVVTNGDQYIIFEALRTGVNWDEGDCIIFYNLSDIEKNFTELWNILGKDCVEINALAEIISGKVEELQFVRVVDDVHFKNERKPRNDLSRYMAPIITYAFQEITEPDKVDMLRTCYVYEKEFEQVDMSLKANLSQDSPAFDEGTIKKIIEDDKSAGSFGDDLSRFRKLLDVEYQEPIIFLLLGRVGSGKTTFVYRFFHAVLNEEERNRTIWIYVSMRDAPTDENSIRSYILESIVSDLSTRYSKAMSYVRDELGYTEISSSLNDIKPLFAILKAKYTIYLVIDNVDQHKSKSPNYHELAFLEANNLTKTLRIMTILTLREESFYTSSTTGVFNAYYINKYIIRAPDFIRLVLFRLDYVLAKLNLPEAEYRKLLKTNVDFGNRVSVIRDFLGIVRDSIQSKGTRGISAFMKNISGENMRMALDLFSNFLISGNTKIDEILTIYRETGSYQIAFHQFLKSIMLGDYRYYSQEYSHIMNVFDFNSEHSNSHFLCLKILAYAKDHLNNDSEIGRGYVSINTLRNSASDVLINTKAIEDSLLRLAKRGLIVLDTRSAETLEGAAFFKVTECGAYYVDVLINRFAYVDLVLADTPIADPDLVTGLRKVIYLTELEARFDRTKRFISYLREMEDREMDLNPEYRESPLAKYRFTSTMDAQFDKEREYILSQGAKGKNYHWEENESYS